MLLSTDEHPLWGPIIFALYVVTALLGLHFNTVNTFAAPVWAPAGIAVAALLIRGNRVWIWIFSAALLINLYLGAPLVIALVIAAGNTLEVVAAAYALNRFVDPLNMFRKLHDTLVFIAVAYVAGIIGATIGVAALWLGGLLGGSEVLVTWLAWRSGDTLGILTITPLVITWSASYTFPFGTIREHFPETLTLIAVLLGLNVLNFFPPAGIPPSVPLLYLVSLPLAWAAVRFGPRGVALATLVNFLIALGVSSMGKGPFIGPTFETGLLFLQIYIAVTSATFLVFASIVKELTATRDALEQHVDELEYAVRKISSEDRAKADFLAELAHELRNPLAPVVSALELIGVKKIADPEIVESLDIIKKQTSTMSHLLNDLLDISRISRRKVTLAKKTLDVRQVIENAVQTAEPFLQTRHHQLSVLLGPKPLWTEIDPVRIEQVIVNILNNAAKYTNTGGVIEVRSQKKDDQVIISIRDNGIGIPKTMLARIFEPFLQLSSGDISRASGLGIGLSLTKHLVELHHGTIEAKSEGTGQGTEFIVHLPSASAPSAPVEVPQSALALEEQKEKRSPRKRKNGKRRVLIVDDNERAAQSLAKLVEYRGHTVRLAYDGPTALSIAPEFKPHLIILDIGLPQMDGYEVARRMRELNQPMVLVALTGYGLEEDKKKALMAGFDHHLVKPVSIAKLDPMLE